MGNFLWHPRQRSPKFRRLDPWDVRQRFLALDFQDEQKVLAYLNETGPFGEPRIHRIGIEAQAREARRVMTEEMLNDKHVNIVGESLQTAFCLGADRAPRITLTAHTSMDAIWLSIFLDKAAHIRFAFCQRHDCPKHRTGRVPFELTSFHRRQYCSQYCAHLENIRKLRRAAQRSTKRETGEKTRREPR